MDEACQRTVYSALMENLQLHLHYKKRDEKEVAVYPVVHPLPVVQRGGIIYLVCAFASDDDVRTLAMHRIREAQLVYEDVQGPHGFDVEAFIASGAFGFLTGPPVKSRARFQRPVAEHLFETPLAPDRRLEPEPDGAILFSATVAATRTLVFWLTGFGAAVELLDPPDLRAEMVEIARGFAASYLQNDATPMQALSVAPAGG